MSKQSEKPSGNHLDPDAVLERARELHNLGADWEKAWGRATLEGRIGAWPSGWGDDLQILIYGDFGPPKKEMHTESLGITIHPEKVENTIIHSVLCVLKATVTIEDKSVDALLDASRRINVFLGAWALVTLGNSACGWWSYITRGSTGGVGTMIDDESLSSAVEGILRLPQQTRKKVDAALYWVREARGLLFESYRSDLLQMYTAYWNAFECLVEAINLAKPRIGPSRTDKQKLVDQFMAQCSGKPSVADIQRCYQEIVAPGFIGKAKHALEVCFPHDTCPNLAKEYAEECFELRDKHDRLYQIRNDINHGNVDAENPDEQIRIAARLTLLRIIVLQMFGRLVRCPAPAVWT